MTWGSEPTITKAETSLFFPSSLHEVGGRRQSGAMPYTYRYLGHSGVSVPAVPHHRTLPPPWPELTGPTVRATRPARRAGLTRSRRQPYSKSIVIRAARFPKSDFHYPQLSPRPVSITPRLHDCAATHRNIRCSYRSSATPGQEPQASTTYGPLTPPGQPSPCPGRRKTPGQISTMFLAYHVCTRTRTY